MFGLHKFLSRAVLWDSDIGRKRTLPGTMGFTTISRPAMYNLKTRGALSKPNQVGL